MTTEFARGWSADFAYRAELIVGDPVTASAPRLREGLLRLVAMEQWRAGR